MSLVDMTPEDRGARFTPDMPADEARLFEKFAASNASGDEIVTIDQIRAAARAITPFIKRTPTLRDNALSERFGTNVYLKYEILQHTGAFKVRGAFNKMLSLSDDERRRGVVAVSGGNHAQAVAYAGQKLGIDVMTLMPDFTPENYVRQTKQYGASIKQFPTLADAFTAAKDYCSNGLTLVHPFDDPAIVCGQGTIGLEILRHVPDVTDIIVSIGGGGLAGGVGVAIKSVKPDVCLWGVETKGADSLARALAAGKPVDIGEMTSIARTLGATTVGELPFRLIRKYLSDNVVVSDDDAVRELYYLLDHCKVLTEPASSCTVAALDRLKGKFKKGSHVVLVLCGGNVGLSELNKLSPNQITMEKVNLREKLELISEYWRPKVVGALNGQEVKLVKFKGEFPWHHHENEDEMFMAVRGSFRIEFRDQTVQLDEGELLVVPHGVEHRTVADEEVSALVFEPTSTRNTGNIIDEIFTAPSGVRI